MKMKPEHYATLQRAVEQVLSVHNAQGELVACYENGEFHNADKTKDLQKRFCFDVLYGTGLNKWVRDELYPYLNDDHIYTALKQCCPKVRRKAP